MGGKTSLVDIGGALLWTASAVAVAGYTWDAFTNTYSRFPSPGSGDGTSSAIEKAAATVEKKVAIPVGKGVIKQAIPGATPIKSQGAVDLTKKPSGSLVSQAKNSLLHTAEWFISHWG